MDQRPTYEELAQRVKELEKEAIFLKRADADLQAKEAFLDRVIDQSPFAIWIIS